MFQNTGFICCRLVRISSFYLNLTIFKDLGDGLPIPPPTNVHGGVNIGGIEKSGCSGAKFLVSAKHICCARNYNGSLTWRYALF